MGDSETTSLVLDSIISEVWSKHFIRRAVDYEMWRDLIALEFATTKKCERREKAKRKNKFKNLKLRVVKIGGSARERGGK